MIGVARWLRQWTGRSDLEARASAVVAESFREPDEVDVAWLTQLVPEGDDDHARWELRYARRALVLISARRDALNDLTASAIARALQGSLAADPNVDEAKREIAVRQFNLRLRSYGEALEERTAEPVLLRLGKLLVRFAGAEATGANTVERAGALVVGYLNEANGNLRRHFGAASLPEDVRPSLLPANDNR